MQFFAYLEMRVSNSRFVVLSVLTILSHPCGKSILQLKKRDMRKHCPLAFSGLITWPTFPPTPILRL